MYTVHKSFCLVLFYIYILFGFVLYLLFIEKKRVSKRKEFDRGNSIINMKNTMGKNVEITYFTVIFLIFFFNLYKRNHREVSFAIEHHLITCICMHITCK